MTVIYLAMALTETPELWHGQFHFYVRRELEQIEDVTVTQFIGLKPDADESEVYKYDINLAKSADLMVALMRIPSFGVGQEIQSRGGMRKPKPTLLLHPKDQYLSRLCRGTPGTITREYNSGAQDGIRQARQIACHVCDYLKSHR